MRAQAGDFETYTERVATLQRLHPELKVERVLWRQPGVLKVQLEVLFTKASMYLPCHGWGKEHGCHPSGTGSNRLSFGHGSLQVS